MREQVESFLNYLSVERGLSANTVAAYRNDLSSFVEWAERELGRRGLVPSWSEVDRDLLLNYFLELKSERGYASATMARKIAAVRSFFNFLVNERVVEKDPAKGISGPRIGRPLPQVLSATQVEELLSQPAKHSTPEAQRDKAMLELLYATGMRVGELVSLDLEDVDLENGFVRCFGKGGKERLIPIHERAIRELKTYLEESRPRLAPPGEKALFVNRRGGRLTRQGFWLILKSYAKELGIEKLVTPHTIRHSIATHLLHSGRINLRELQEFLGHANISTTQIYTHLTSEHLRRVYERSHPRAK